MPVHAVTNFHPFPETGERVSAYVRHWAYPLPVIWDMHQAFEIAVVLSGHYDRHFPDLVLHLEPGDVVLSSAWEPHGRQPTAAGTVLLSVWFPPEFLGDEALGEVPWPSFFGASPGDRPKVTSEEMRRQVLAVAAEMSQEIEERDQGWLTGIRLGVYRLLFILGRKWTSPPAGRRRPPLRLSDLSRVGPAVSLVHARRGRPVSVEEGAAACCLSPSRFCALFRQSMGLSFGKYVLRSRLVYVARLLLIGDDSLDAIAEELEFADRSHLHHAFRKHYGCTPGHYRERRLLLLG
jgi:AraC-like DNA-binding protein